MITKYKTHITIMEVGKSFNSSIRAKRQKY